MRALRPLGAGLAAVLVTAAALVGLSPTPASAAACSGSGGASVIVDFAQLGGVRAGCDTSVAGQTAQGVFADAGFPLTMAPGGFVCRVSGVPTQDNCADAAPADAYWSLWTADGKGGGWVYASRGVGSLRVPEGGYVAFSWHQGSGRAAPPSVTPTRRQQPTQAPSPQPTKNPTKQPTQAPTKNPTRGPSNSTPGPSAGPTSASTDPSASAPDPSATASDDPSASESASESAGADASSSTTGPSATPTGEPTSAADVTAGPVADMSGEASEGSDGGLPILVPVLAVLGVLGAGALVVLRRRSA